MQTPPNWPPDITFLSCPQYSSKITSALLNAFHTPTPSTASHPKIPHQSPSPQVLIRPIPSTAPHPAAGQRGLFAARPLTPGEFIIQYTGAVHPNEDSDERSDYDLSLDRDLGLSIDAGEAGNEARFINDYRSVAAGPNAEFRDVWVRMPDGHVRRWERGIGVFVLPAGKAGRKAKGIGKGEEILVNYGRGFWRERRAETESRTTI